MWNGEKDGYKKERSENNLGAQRTSCGGFASFSPNERCATAEIAVSGRRSELGMGWGGALGGFLVGKHK